MAKIGVYFATFAIVAKMTPWVHREAYFSRKIQYYFLFLRQDFLFNPINTEVILAWPNKVFGAAKHKQLHKHNINTKTVNTKHSV